jgi:hypothetical protein
MFDVLQISSSGVGVEQNQLPALAGGHAKHFFIHGYSNQSYFLVYYAQNTIATRNEAVMVTEQTPIPSAISVNPYPNPHIV